MVEQEPPSLDQYRWRKLPPVNLKRIFLLNRRNIFFNLRPIRIKFQLEIMPKSDTHFNLWLSTSRTSWVSGILQQLKQSPVSTNKKDFLFTWPNRHQ